MKRTITVISILFLVYGIALSQSCLPEGIEFTTQEQIDNFQINHPNCTEIEGDVRILGNDITNLSGLSIVTSIGGDFDISFNYSLTSLSDLYNVSSIGGDLAIKDSDALTTLSGLENVTSIGGDLAISNNDALTTLSGLGNIEAGSINNLRIDYNISLSTCEVQSICDYLVSPGGMVDIFNNASGCNNPAEVASACGITLSCLPYGNYSFFSQTDIDNFQSNYPGCAQLEGDVRISGNDITNLSGLSVVTSFLGGLWINDNYVLTSLSGLENVTSIVGDLGISFNNILTSLSGLENLTSIGGNLTLYHNNTLTSLSGLENVISIGGYLWIRGNNALTSLSGLDNVTYIGGYLDIRKNDLLTVLSGLENVTFIGGNLVIGENDALTILSGLDNVTSIGGLCKIEYNPVLISLSGLDNVTSIGGYLVIRSNYALTSLSGLENVISIGGHIWIYYNEALISLTGMDNIEAESISSLQIYNNISLSTCDVQSVCDYLISPNAVVHIYHNATGCYSQEEVEEACLVSVGNINPVEISIFPNPANRQLTISIKDRTIEEVNIFNQTGQTVIHEKPKNNIFDVSYLQPGMYIIEIVSDKKIIREKLMVE